MQGISKLDTMLARNVPALVINLALAPLRENIQLYVMAFARGAPNRRFFITRDGYMGIGPQNTRNGDQICVFDGGPVPMVLRSAEVSAPSHISHSTPSQQGHFLLVGECYVHGLMNGEVVAREHRHKCRDIILM